VTKDDFIRGCVLVLCVLILAACAAGVIRAANHKKADAMLREYYGDTLGFAVDSFYYFKDEKNYRNYQADNKNTFLLNNAIEPRELLSFEMNIPAAVSADTESITVTLTSTQADIIISGGLYIERKLNGDWYILNQNTRSVTPSLILSAGEILELNFPLGGKYPPGEYRLAAHIFGAGIAPAERFYVAAEFVIE